MYNQDPYSAYAGLIQQYGFGQQNGPLPRQQVVQVNGKASVDTIRLAPNSSILVMDTTAPIVWMCVSDGVGKVTATPYDISEHKDPPPIDTKSMEERISKVENAVNKIMEAITNAKSNGQSVEQGNSATENRTA